MGHTGRFSIIMSKNAPLCNKLKGANLEALRDYNSNSYPQAFLFLYSIVDLHIIINPMTLHELYTSSAKCVFAFIVAFLIHSMTLPSLCAYGTAQDSARVLTLDEYIEKADKYWFSKNPKKALQVLAECQQHYPDETEVYRRRVILLVSTGKKKEALKETEALLVRQPDMYLAHYCRALLLIKFNRDDEAWKETEIAVSIDPSEAIIYVLRGEILYRARKFNEAVIAYDNLISRRSTPQGEDYMLRAEAYAQAGDYNHACLDYRLAKMYGSFPPNDIDLKKLCK